MTDIPDHYFSSPGVSKEFQFLLRLISNAKHESSIDINIDKFIRMLRYHSTLLVVSKCWGTHLDEKITAAMKGHLIQQTMFQLKMVKSFVEIVKTFNQQNLSVLPLKGPSLADELLGDPVIRESQDIDLLVRPEDAESAIRLLESLGYTCENDISEFSKPQWNAFIKVVSDLVFWNKEYPFRIELHWKMFAIEELMPYSTNEIFQQSEKVAFKNCTYLRPSTEIYLVYLCLHGTKHQWYRLKWILDVHFWLKKYHQHIDGKKFLQLLVENGVEKSVSEGLFLSRKLFGSPLPTGWGEEMIEELKLSKVLEKRVQELDTDAPAAPKFYFRTHKLMALKRGVRHKLTCLVHLKHYARDWQLVQLPAYLFFMYPILRPWFFMYRKIRKAKA
ncbi:MAG: nucleotidyltransferase family protein [Cytophagales bacterium]|nr:nucleotidyltransferase family protein [Cytophagales bacterium]